MGAYTVMSIAQGGCGLPFLATAVFRYYVYGECTGVTINARRITEIDCKEGM